MRLSYLIFFLIFLNKSTIRQIFHLTITVIRQVYLVFLRQSSSLKRKCNGATLGWKKTLRCGDSYNYTIAYCSWLTASILQTLQIEPPTAISVDKSQKDNAEKKICKLKRIVKVLNTFSVIFNMLKNPWTDCVTLQGHYSKE